MTNPDLEKLASETAYVIDLDTNTCGFNHNVNLIKSALERATEGLRAELNEEKQIMSRVWIALDIATYDEAKPHAIDEHVSRLKNKVKELDGYLALYGASDRLVEGQPDAIRMLANLRAQLAESNAQVSAWKTEAELMCHKVIACGIIAEGNEHLNPIYQRDGKWDSQQADKVRELRAQLATASEDSRRLDWLEKQDASYSVQFLQRGFVNKHSAHWHQVRHVREAIDAAMAQQKGGG